MDNNNCLIEYAPIFFNYKLLKIGNAPIFRICLLIDDPYVTSFYFEEDASYDRECNNGSWDKIKVKNVSLLTSREETETEFVFYFGTKGEVSNMQHNYFQLTVDFPMDSSVDIMSLKSKKIKIVGFRRDSNENEKGIKENKTEEGTIIFEPGKLGENNG